MEKSLFGGHLTRLYSQGDPNDDENVLLHKHEGKKSKLLDVPALWEHPTQGRVKEYRAMGSEMRVQVEPEERFGLAGILNVPAALLDGRLLAEDVS